MKELMQRADKAYIGFLVGLIVPMLVFVLYWLFFYHKMNFPFRFVKYLMGGYLLSNVTKLCALFNLGVFYLGLKYETNRFNRGIIYSLIVYIAFIAYLTFYFEEDLGE
jgi:hypothetical protein